MNSTDPQRDSCVGCDNVEYSGKELNPCSFCIDSTRDDFDTYGEDCNGTCQGNAQTDSCGKCMLPSSTEWNSCVGCDGVVDSTMKENECGFCADPEDQEFDDYGRFVI